MSGKPVAYWTLLALLPFTACEAPESAAGEGVSFDTIPAEDFRIRGFASIPWYADSAAIVGTWGTPHRVSRVGEADRVLSYDNQDFLEFRGARMAFILHDGKFVGGFFLIPAEGWQTYSQARNGMTRVFRRPPVGTCPPGYPCLLIADELGRRIDAAATWMEDPRLEAIDPLFPMAATADVWYDSEEELVGVTYREPNANIRALLRQLQAAEAVAEERDRRFGVPKSPQEQTEEP